MPGPAHYSHTAGEQRFKAPHQAEGYTFAASQRDIQKVREPSKEPPGPGNYDPALPKTGTAKSFLGGPEKKKDKHNGVPSPGKHSIKYPKEAPSWSFGNPDDKKRSGDEQLANLGPGTHEPKYSHFANRHAAFSMAAKGGRGPAVDDGTELSAKIRNVQKKKRDQVQFMGVPGP